jgi:hypothetical protein
MVTRRILEILKVSQGFQTDLTTQLPVLRAMLELCISGDFVCWLHCRYRSESHRICFAIALNFIFNFRQQRDFQVVFIPSSWRSFDKFNISVDRYTIRNTRPYV